MNKYKKSSILFPDTNSFDKLLIDFLANDEFLKKFQSSTFSISGIKELANSYSTQRVDRKLLADLINSQNHKASISISAASTKNLELIKSEKTFTISTGHQLMLMGGPLYVTYKILDIISVARQLSIDIPEFNFVPVFWMASEDHDIAEISYVNIFSKKISWNSQWKGAAGRAPLESINEFAAQLEETIRTKENGSMLYETFLECYSHASNLSIATRRWINHWFGENGILILDADDEKLKKLFGDVIQDDILTGKSYEFVKEANNEISQRYIPQANPREINFFYLEDEHRERIILKDDEYTVSGRPVHFTKEQLKTEIAAHPQKFSPNVLMRPLYQQAILPNILYCGGPAEIAYWLELRKVFEHYNITMPVLLMRSSAMIFDGQSIQKLKKLGIEKHEIFRSADELIREKIAGGDDISQLNTIIACIDKEFDDLVLNLVQIDKTLQPAAEAERKKILNGLSVLEDKIVRAKKRNNESSVVQLKKLKEKFFPGGKLQERTVFFAEKFLTDGNNFLPSLQEHLNPLEKKFLLLAEEE